MIQSRDIQGLQYDESYFPESELIVPKRDIYIRDTGYIYKLEQVHCGSDEYDIIMSKIDSDIFNVIRIDRVKNTFLEKAFELRKQQYPEQNVKQLFHITLPKSAKSICKHNFNWRFFGKRSEITFMGRVFILLLVLNTQRHFTENGHTKEYFF
ncbi:hypothetical protein WA026_013677 [Henosepilachna vigintioctopunctata]|uniref:Uncharacterized protein n=1 Tax=Henosepilachna vigintioctopunctata TaxID=420089 RepID=A0AAW1UQR0_9CUCU